MFPVISQSYLPILISRFAFGIGIGLFNPMAVGYISFLFDKSEVPTLIGFRTAVESLGQGLFAMLAGLLFQFGWNMSFLVYGVAFLLLVIFYIKVPDIKLSNENSEDSSESTLNKSMPSLVYPIVLFAFVIIICAASIGIRFPSLAASVRYDGYNSSNIVAIQPIFNIFAAIIFGKLHHLLGRRLLFVGMLSLIIAHFMIALSNGSYGLIIVALFIHGLVPAWIFPFIFNMVSRITSGKNQNLAISLVMVGANMGMFSAPFVFRFIENLFGFTTLIEIYPILATIVGLMLIVIIALGKKFTKLTPSSVTI